MMFYGFTCNCGAFVPAGTAHVCIVPTIVPTTNGAPSPAPWTSNALSAPQSQGESLQRLLAEKGAEVESLKAQIAACSAEQDKVIRRIAEISNPERICPPKDALNEIYKLATEPSVPDAIAELIQADQRRIEELVNEVDAAEERIERISKVARDLVTKIEFLEPLIAADRQFAGAHGVEWPSGDSFNWTRDLTALLDALNDHIREKLSEVAPGNGESTSISVRDRLVEDLPKDEELRYEYDEEFLNTYISAQTRALREDRGLTQTQLAKLAKTGQSQISEMEGEYNSWSLRTLRKLARAFGVRLFVSFESWGELLPRVEGFRRETLVRPVIEKDGAFKPEASHSTH